MTRLLLTCVGMTLITCLCAGCVVQQRQAGGGSAAAPRAVRGTGEAPVMRVNGTDVYAGDLVSSPLLRQGLRVFVHALAVEQEAQRLGVSIDEQRFEDEMESRRISALETGKTWEEWLAGQSVTEEEYRDRLRGDMLFWGLVEEGLEITEKRMRDIWEERQEYLVNLYIRRYHAPESERESITFEDCQDIIREEAWRYESGLKQNELWQRLFNEMELELTCFDSPDDAKLYRELILLSIQTKEGGGLAPQAPALGGGAEQSGVRAPAGTAGRMHEHDEPAEEDAE